MNCSELNDAIKKLAEQLQRIDPLLDIARGKEARIMQETTEADTVEDEIEIPLAKVYEIIRSSGAVAREILETVYHPLIEKVVFELQSLEGLPAPHATMRPDNTASLHEGYIESYINLNIDGLAEIRRLSNELSNVSLYLLTSQQLRNVIEKINRIVTKCIDYAYSKIDYPNPYDLIRREISELLNVIEMTQKLCAYVSKSDLKVFIRLHHSISDAQKMVNRGFRKGETPPKKLTSIQDELSQAFENIANEYMTLLEELAVQFEADHVIFAENPDIHTKTSTDGGDKNTV